MTYPDVVATSSSAPSQFSSGTQVVDFYQYQNTAAPEIHMQVKTYYTGADSTLWRVFDGDVGMPTQVQEPDLLFEGENEEARVHSVAGSKIIHDHTLHDHKNIYIYIYVNNCKHM
jgi:hypothetical protein